MALGFEIVNVNPTQPGRQVARFVCNACRGHLDLQMPGGRLNPEHQAKRAARHGWEADASRPSRVRCPECQGKAKPKRATEAAPVVSVEPAPPPEPKQAEIIPMNASKPAATVTAISKPSADQRLQIRNLLDRHFDDATGGYLDGMSDQKVAEAANVPRIVVEQIRDAGWGPLRISPEVMELRAELAKAGAELSRATAELHKLGTRVAELAGKVERIAGAAAA